MTEDQIKHMVDRFLSWKLPENFNPDGGVSFKKTFNEHTPRPAKHEPSGTNLLDATQATAMVRHMLEGLPPSPAQRRMAGIIEKMGREEYDAVPDTSKCPVCHRRGPIDDCTLQDCPQ
jgi:hypothetical protein